MTGSDYAVLAFLSGALIFAPKTWRSTALLLGMTIIVGMIALISGCTELLLAAGTVLAILALVFLRAGLPIWKNYWLPMLKSRLQTERLRGYEDIFSHYQITPGAEVQDAWCSDSISSY
jgi:hypothetical protein